MKDLEEIPENVKKGLKIIPVSTVDEVLALALTKPLVPSKWTEAADTKKVIMDDAEGESASGVRH